MRALNILLVVIVILGQLKAQTVDGEIFDKAPELEDYNFVCGTQAIGANYKFTKESFIVEQAKHIQGMGSNILKISMGKNYAKSYGMKPASGIKTTLDLIKKKEDYQKVMDMDFKYIFAWVHTFTEAKWQDGLTSEEKLMLYREMYELTEYVLKTYSGSGKTFLFGNWEGDWLLHGLGKRDNIPSDEKVQGMIDWFNIRQIAVDDAKRNTPHEEVEVWHYIELNLVTKGLEGKKCIVNSVLPHTNPDLVSYSSYEIIKKKPTYLELKKAVGEAMDYIESKLAEKDGVPFKRRVYIGEYGYQTNANQDDAKQLFLTKRMMRVSLDLNLPFALHWEMYNNEYTNAGVSKGMSMISEEGKKKPVYYLHQNFYSEMNEFLKTYKNEHKVYPEYEVFKKKGIEVLGKL
ncbi:MULTISPECIES: hypothetical protein [Carboxylicivirga]|uniref:Glycoside hydrolase family 5 domain-containing protein n=1 Tax=Carboxylicivirga mesophila TaxID=1166478 RepID=A0ABS5KE15_9BACT|nr:hypothetical protein [Carboxylicivirga mesophila]MBS2213117.1 hypothetical protein [Carboxylicivirga mesophila]